MLKVLVVGSLFVIFSFLPNGCVDGSNTFSYSPFQICRRLKENNASLDDLRALIELFNQEELAECLREINGALIYNSGVTPRWREKLNQCCAMIVSLLSDLQEEMLEKIDSAEGEINTYQIIEEIRQRLLKLKQQAEDELNRLISEIEAREPKSSNVTAVKKAKDKILHWIDDLRRSFKEYYLDLLG